MELSADDYREMVNQMGTAPSRSRRAPRTYKRARLAIAPVGPDGVTTAILVQLLDLSLRGMAILHHQAMPRGSQFIARITRGGDDPVRILCTVTRCHPVRKGLFSIGVEFTCLAVWPDPTQVADPRQTERIRKSILG